MPRLPPTRVVEGPGPLHIQALLPILLSSVIPAPGPLWCWLVIVGTIVESYQLGSMRSGDVQQVRIVSGSKVPGVKVGRRGTQEQRHSKSVLLDELPHPSTKVREGTNSLGRA